MGRFSILSKLLVAFGVPTGLLFVGFAYLAYELSRRDLEAELGTRLQVIGASAATQIRGKYLVELEPGDRDDLYYQNARRKLLEIKTATGVARLRIFDKQLRSVVDTDDTAIGSTNFAAGLDRFEIDKVFEGRTASSVLFEGGDHSLYKSGYAPVFSDPDKDRQVVLALGIDAPADFFTRLQRLRSTLVYYGGMLAFLVAIISVALAARLTKPLRKLADSAARIGRGDLEEPVEPGAGDEIGLLARTMETMRSDLQTRDLRLQMMLAGIAHEVRNPLGGMELYVGLLREELAGDPTRVAHVQKIARELSHLSTVVSDFLEFARRRAPSVAWFELGKLAGEVVDLLGPEAERAGVTIAVETAGVAQGDEGQLRRVLLNLLRNAIQASPPGARVTVRAAGHDGLAEIAVANPGGPIDPEITAKMFDPFYTTREKGTGLGLALVRDILFDHSGTIAVECEGGVTTFRARIPGWRPA